MVSALDELQRQEAVATSLRRDGLDLIHWFWVDDANQGLEHPHRLPHTGRAGLLIGNSKALWGPFEDWWQVNTDAIDPLDSYVRDSVLASVHPLRPTWAAYAHDLEPNPIPIQRYAQAAGFALMSPVGLSIHHTYGPWIALRAIVAFDATRLQPSAGAAFHHCDDCHRPCLEPFRLAQNHTGRDGSRRYLPVRQACPVGREHAYSRQQTDYHYDGTRPAWLDSR